MGAITFLSQDPVWTGSYSLRPFTLQVLNMIKLYGKPIRVNKATQDKKTLDVGSNLFIGNLDPDVDEKMLYDTFSAFGVVVATPKIMRDPDTGVSHAPQRHTPQFPQ